MRIDIYARMVDYKCYVYSSMFIVHKAIIAGPAGPSSTRPVFWPSMLTAVSLLLLSAHFTLCLPFIDAIINNARCVCENIEKI